MTENKRFTIKPQDDYFGVTDNYSGDKVNVVNGIRTEIEAEWLCELLNELNDENEQLKATIKEVIELLSDEVDVFSEKATEHDIIAYRELNQLDNKDAYYMATATKKAIKILKGV